MGQLLIVQDKDEHKTVRLLNEGLRAFESLCQLSPSDQLLQGTTAIAKFPRRLGSSSAIVRDSHTKSWTCGVGTWVYNSLTDEQLLQTIGREFYKEDGNRDSCLLDIDGSFSIVTGDGFSGEFTVITDRIGTLHTYVTFIGSALVVSTSSMILAVLSNPAWDLTSCREFLTTGTIFENRTLFENIKKLEPASVIRSKDLRFGSKVKYWNVADVLYDRASTRGDVPTLATALQESLLKISRKFAKPIMDLTGGLDSRAVLGAMLKIGIPFETVVNGSENDPDVLTANLIAQRYRLDHRHQALPVDWQQRWWRQAKSSLSLCDGEYDILEYARILENHNRLAKDFDVSVNGSGGEFCKGYWWELLYPFVGWKERFNERRVAESRFVYDTWSVGLLCEEFTETMEEHFAGVIRRTNVGLEGYPNTAKMDNVYLTLRMQRWYGRIASSTNRIWPAIAPFMFKKPMETALSAPPYTRVRNRMSRRLIEQLDPSLAAMPLAQGYPALPLNIRTAYLFWPLVAELSGKVLKRLKKIVVSDSALPVHGCNKAIIHVLEEEEVKELLQPEGMLTRELYNIENLMRFLSSVEKNPTVQASHLGRLITLEVLARTIKKGKTERSM